VEIVDQDLLFQSPQEYERIIGGKGEEESLWRSIMVVQMKLKNPRKPLGKKPLLYGKPNMAVGVISHSFG
jgi:hypothetical protein